MIDPPGAGEGPDQDGGVEEQDEERDRDAGPEEEPVASRDSPPG